MLASEKSKPLSGLKIVEFAGIGPGPFACMMLADMGAEIIRIERPHTPAQTIAYGDPEKDFLARGRKSIALNLKTPGSLEIIMRIIKQSDGLVEGFRPGVMERLGVGPKECLAHNPKLVYGRMTGWGQEGPLAHAAGHDLNYIAITGALWASGEASRAPTFPLNLLGDFGGGGMYLAFGMVCALLKAQATGKGDVVDAAICDGTSNLMTFIHSRRAMGHWVDKREANALDGGAPWYGVYECADGKWITIGAIEPQFWQCLIDLLELDEAELGNRMDPANWPSLRKKLEQVFIAQPQHHWCELLEGTDACFAPVLSPAEAREYPHNVARNLFDDGKEDQPMPAPKFGSTAAELPSDPVLPGTHTKEVLSELGFSSEEISDLQEKNIVSTA